MQISYFYYESFSMCNLFLQVVDLAPKWPIPLLDQFLSHWFIHWNTSWEFVNSRDSAGRLEENSEGLSHLKS